MIRAATVQADILVTRDKALADYLAMGSARSLAKLYQHYTETGLNPPAMSTMKSWSGSHSWQQRALEYDACLQQVTHEAMAQKQALKQAEDMFDLQSGLARCVNVSVMKAMQALEEAPVRTLSDAKRALEIASAAAQLYSHVADSTMRMHNKSAKQREVEAQEEAANMLAHLAANTRR